MLRLLLLLQEVLHPDNRRVRDRQQRTEHVVQIITKLKKNQLYVSKILINFL
jgi:hypothetical protein